MGSQVDDIVSAEINAGGRRDVREGVASRPKRPRTDMVPGVLAVKSETSRCGQSSSLVAASATSSCAAEPPPLAPESDDEFAGCFDDAVVIVSTQPDVPTISGQQQSKSAELKSEEVAVCGTSKE